MKSCYVCKNADCWREYGEDMFDCKITDKDLRDAIFEGIDEHYDKYAEKCEYYDEVEHEAEKPEKFEHPDYDCDTCGDRDCRKCEWP